MQSENHDAVLTAANEQDVAETPAPTRSRIGLVFLLALLGFFGMAAGWALALPVNGTYDEVAHITRAYGVASGQIYAHAGTQQVPRSLLPANPTCDIWPRGAASCLTPPPADHSRIPVATGAAAYSPLYYLPVGIPMLISPNQAGIVAGRLVSALLSALFLAAAVAIAVRLRKWLLLAGVILVGTPMVIDLAGAINPNGLEISAAILAWTALLALVRTRDGELDERLTHRLVLLAAVGTVILLTIRHLGPLLAPLMLGAVALLAGRRRLRVLIARRDVRWSGAVLVAAFIAAVAWILTSGVADIGGVPVWARHYTRLHELHLIFTQRLKFNLSQVVGQFSYGEVVMSRWTTYLWYLPMIVLAGSAFLVSGRRYRWTVALLAAASLAVLVGLDIHFLPIAGWVSQSRYILPAAAGVVLAAGFARLRFPVLLARTAVTIAIPIQLYALGLVMTRFQRGPGFGWHPFGGAWLPPGGVLPALTTGAVGAITLGVLVWWVTGRIWQPDRDQLSRPEGSTAVPFTH